MAVQHVCDGCGAAMGAGVEPSRYGIVRQRDYCMFCAPHVLRFLKARDDCHTELAKTWADSLDVLKAALRASLPDAKLPDE